MKLRTIAILTAVGVLSIVGCGDDITNIIEEVVATPPPVTSGPATPTNTPIPVVTGNPTNTPTRNPECVTPGAGVDVVCGDGICHAPESCDIGGICVGGSNDLATCTSPGDCPGGRCTVVGGQPSGSGSCSANCTLETRRTGAYAAASGANVQTGAFAVPVALTGTQTIQTGARRADDTIDINGDVTFRAGDIPMVTKAPDIRIDPAKVPGLVCACVRGIEVPAFGPGNSATGVISCGGELEDIDYVMTQDHRTDPLDGFATNPECSHPADPECDDETEIVTGVISRPCREQVDADCNISAENKHAGVCNSARIVEYSGSGPAGSGIIFNNTAIGLLSDRGLCDTTLGGMSPCPFPEYGPDCLPCTDDDLDKGVAENNPTTTGRARATVFNLGNNANFHVSEGSSTPCTDNSQCSGDVCGLAETCLDDTRAPGTKVCGVRCGSNLCLTTAVGRPFSCEALMDNPTGGLEGGAFAVTFPSIDAATIADNVTAVIFDFGQ